MAPENILFLDLDGVICCNFHGVLEPDKLQHVKRICEATQSKVVLSTDWRRRPDLKQRAVQTLASVGVKVIGSTPEFPQGSRKVRPLEILKWMKDSQNLEVRGWCAVDDRDLVKEEGGNALHGHFVLTEWASGLTRFLADRCISKIAAADAGISTSVASSVAAKRLERSQQRLAASPQQHSHVPGPHVVFLEMASDGHINPVLPLISELCNRGCLVTVFVAPSIAQDTLAALKQTGASTCMYRDDGRIARTEPLLAARTFRQGVVGTELRWLPSLLDDLRALQPAPSILLYDTFITIAIVAGLLAGLPTVGLIPHCGPGWLASDETDAAVAELSGPREWLRQHYGVELLEHGQPPLGWFHNSTSLNLVLTCQELFSPPSSQQEWVRASIRQRGSLVSAPRT